MLEQALAYGQKHAADRLAGPGLDLRPRLRRRRRRRQPRHHPAIPAGEFEKPELLRLEKETLGLYVSEHPLHAVRDQLRRKTDCDARRARAPPRRRGRHRRRDRLGGQAADDEEGRADGLPRASTTRPARPRSSSSTRPTRTARELCVADRILVVKGRVDHKQQGETKLIALEVTAFEAVPERREVRFRLDAREAPAGVIRELARLVREYPGESPVLRRARDLDGARRRSRSAPSTASRPTRTSSPRRRRSSAPTRSSNP